MNQSDIDRAQSHYDAREPPDPDDYECEGCKRIASKCKCCAKCEIDAEICPCNEV